MRYLLGWIILASPLLVVLGAFIYAYGWKFPALLLGVLVTVLVTTSLGLHLIDNY